MADLNIRQQTIIRILHQLGSGHTAYDITMEERSDAILGDSRGVAQTIRHMPEYVEKAPKGGYRLTRKGTYAAKALEA